MVVPGEILRRAREAARMTQGELAERAGTGQSAISAYETGRREPTVTMLERLLDATGHVLNLEVTPLEHSSGQLPNTPLGRRVGLDREGIRTAVARHGGHRVYLFGSVARGDDHTNSDVDLLVELPERSGILTLGAIAREIEQLLGVEIDVVPVGTLSPEKRELLLREAVEL